MLQGRKKLPASLGRWALRVIVDRREAPLTTVGLPQIAERSTLAERFDGLPSDSFRGRGPATTEESGQYLKMAELP